MKSVGSHVWRIVAAACCALFAACGGAGREASPKSPPPAETSPPMSTAPAPLPSGMPPPPADTECTGVQPGPGYECVRNCGPPVAQASDPDPGYSWLSQEQAENRKKFGCPICLPGSARVATPSGDVPIERLTPGTPVWSLDANGQRVARRVEHVASVHAPSDHRIAVVELDDGRKVSASPGHPDGNGRAVGALTVGDTLDGARVRQISRVRYSGRTFDLVLEAGAVHYFADGVLLRSSLARATSQR